MPSLALIALFALLAVAEPAAAQERVTVGVLRLTSSAPVFMGVERRFFREYRVAPELVYFQAAAPIIAWAGDLIPWQVATVFYSKKVARDRPRPSTS